MRHFLVSIFLWFATVSPVSAEVVTCDGPNITVIAEHSADAECVCKAARQAVAQFGQCSLPFPSHPLRINVVDEMPTHCVAVYHCGEDWIELLSPSEMHIRRKTEGAFSSVETKAFFESVVVHELAHAAFDSVPCPFDACIATSEYIAYVMQIMSLDAASQSDFEAKFAFTRPISRDELSAMIYLMAPGRFAQKAWAHFSQRDDPCGYIALIVEGRIVLDVERF